MTTGDWIGLCSLVLAFQATVVGCAVWIVRNIGEAKAAAPAAVGAHEHECANFEPNTSAQMKALQKVES
jgi:hypothetical protein